MLQRNEHWTIYLPPIVPIIIIPSIIPPIIICIIHPVPEPINIARNIPNTVRDILRYILDILLEPIPFPINILWDILHLLHLVTCPPRRILRKIFNILDAVVDFLLAPVLHAVGIVIGAVAGGVQA